MLGFSVYGVFVSLLAGAMIGVGSAMMKSHNKVLDYDKKEDTDALESAAMRSSMLALSLYTAAPPLVRTFYHSIPLESNDSALYMIVFSNSVGCLSALVVGAALGAGLGCRRCDAKVGRRGRRVGQTALGCGLFSAGLFVGSPQILKFAWTALYSITSNIELRDVPTRTKN